jgi:RNA polymerase sigma factor (sigma-70 family)
MLPADSGIPSRTGPAQPEDRDAILVRHMPALRTYARMNLDPGLRSREAISDLVQSSVREVLAGGATIPWQDEEQLRAYLCTCVTNKILDKKRYWSRAKREQSRSQGIDGEALQLSAIHGPESSTPSALVVRGELIERLQAAFDGLEEREKRLFSMRFIFGLGPTHIGNELATPESTVRKELARLMATLASVLGDIR